MITITKDGDTIHITGHSLPDVCASISSIMYTSLNMLLRYAEHSFDFEDNTIFDFVTIHINAHDRIIDMIIDNMFEMFIDVQSSNNQDNVKILGYETKSVDK